MSNFAPKRTDYSTGDRRWLRDLLASQAHDVTVTDGSFKAGSVGGDGLVKSGSLVTVAGKGGLLKDDLTIKTGETHLVSAVHGGTVDRRYLPAALTKAEETSLSAIAFINGTPPA